MVKVQYTWLTVILLKIQILLRGFNQNHVYASSGINKIYEGFTIYFTRLSIQLSGEKRNKLNTLFLHIWQLTQRSIISFFIFNVDPTSLIAFLLRDSSISCHENNIFYLPLKCYYLLSFPFLGPNGFWTYLKFIGLQRWYSFSSVSINENRIKYKIVDKWNYIFSKIIVPTNTDAFIHIYTQAQTCTHRTLRKKSSP